MERLFRDGRVALQPLSYVYTAACRGRGAASCHLASCIGFSSALAYACECVHGFRVISRMDNCPFPEPSTCGFPSEQLFTSQTERAPLGGVECCSLRIMECCSLRIVECCSLWAGQAGLPAWNPLARQGRPQITALPRLVCPCRSRAFALR